MADAYGHTTGNTPIRPISAVNPGQAQLVLRWETTWEHWVLYAFLFALPRPLRPDSDSPPSQRAHMAHVPLRTCKAPGGPLPRQPAAHDVFSSF